VPPPREVARATPPRPAELALPKRAEKETPALDTPAARERLIERALPPPPAPTAPAVRAPEPPRVTTPQAPPPTPAPPTTATVAARTPVEPMRLGRPDVAVPTTGSISLDVSDFPFTYYLRQLQAKISERWAPPRGSVAGGERVVVLFEIGRDGQIKEPAVEKSSGNAIYDQSALRAVTEASPFPPLPPEFKAPSLKVHFGFEFRPDQG
jgi:protein TonB